MPPESNPWIANDDLRHWTYLVHVQRWNANHPASVNALTPDHTITTTGYLTYIEKIFLRCGVGADVVCVCVTSTGSTFVRCAQVLRGGARGDGNLGVGERYSVWV
jgi:hypothetical protein